MSQNVKSRLEITTQIGCPNTCSKYCPQDVLVSSYKSLYPNDPLRMSLKTFDEIMGNCSGEVRIDFAGHTEPLSNPEAPAMIAKAYGEGHEISLFTTFNGLTVEGFELLKEAKYVEFCFHLPDGVVMKKPISRDYEQLFFRVPELSDKIQYMSMDKFNFKSNNRENVTRGIIPNRKMRFGWCEIFECATRPIVLPNGSVYLCCMDWNLRNKVGNLLFEKYDVIRQRMLKGKYKFEGCSYCSYNLSKPKRFAKQVARKVFNSLIGQ